MAIVIRYMYCLVFISRSSDLIQYGGIVTKANSRLPVFPPPTCDISCLQVPPQWFVQFQVKWRRVKNVI